MAKKTKKSKVKKSKDDAPKKRKRKSHKKEKEEMILASKKQISSRHKKFKKEVGVKIVTASKVKTYFKTIGIRASTDMVDETANALYDVLKKACLRAVKNGRKTVRSWDL